MIPSSAEVTELLVAWSDGDKSAEKELFSLVYRELRGSGTSVHDAGEPRQHPPDNGTGQRGLRSLDR